MTAPVAGEFKPISRLTYNVPNILTAIRVTMAVAIAYLLVWNGWNSSLIAGILLVVAWATDWLDGYLARKLGQATLSGAIFDLFADRILMTTTLIISIVLGYWERTSGMMPLNPFLYAVPVLTADVAVLVGLAIFLWKRRRRMIVYPSPTMIAKITFSVQMPTLAVAVLGIGPDLLLAILMYLSIIFTLIAAVSYLKKGGYVFTQ